MKIKEVTTMPLGKVTTVTPAGTDPSKAVVSIKTPDGKDIQTTADQLIQGPNSTYQLKTAVNQANSNLKPGATITQTPTQIGSQSTTMGSPISTTSTTATTPEESTNEIGGDPTDDFISDVDNDEASNDIRDIRRLSGL